MESVAGEGVVDGPHMPGRSYPCAGGIVLDSTGRLLVIRRGHEPSAGLWSVPGGHLEAHESAQDACVREVAEETGIVVRVVRHAGCVERTAPDGGTFVIDDFVCAPVGGQLRAATDAVDARWVTRAQFEDLPLAPGVHAALQLWNCLPD